MSTSSLLGVFLSVAAATLPAAAQEEFETDVFATSIGELKISFVGHGTLMLTVGDVVIHVDPVSREADYAAMPKADVILVTHEHGDHCDPGAIELLTTAQTELVVNPGCRERVGSGSVMRNGEVATMGEITVAAIPAYNLVHKRDNGQPFHAKGDGNGYVITLGDTRVYVAGDTENTPEMKALEDIDIAFLPMNLPYTMTPAMVADAAKAFRPKILYPYHFGQTDPTDLVDLLAEEPGIEVRLRDMS
ncbi:MAG: MBL fold metallo-hydrolase [Gemmatimonadota bacterium]|nr:MAG: MBL fold metallo-hydrolase [Gemmatimonadota bacterium]